MGKLWGKEFNFNSANYLFPRKYLFIFRLSEHCIIRYSLFIIPYFLTFFKWIYNKNQNIDLVLMDINMPIVNGYDATKKIRQSRPDLPVIAVTAYAMAGDRKKSLDAGCDDYISKPINRTLLIDLIKKRFN